jgi:hypothetical protein
VCPAEIVSRDRGPERQHLQNTRVQEIEQAESLLILRRKNTKRTQEIVENKRNPLGFASGTQAKSTRPKGLPPE